jgi:hypothetical protein
VKRLSRLRGPASAFRALIEGCDGVLVSRASSFASSMFYARDGIFPIMARDWPAFPHLDNAGQRAFWDTLGVQEESGMEGYGSNHLDYPVSREQLSPL